jgi:hypothetical protein
MRHPVNVSYEDPQDHDPSGDDLATIKRQLAEIAREQQNGTYALLDLDDESATLLKPQLAKLSEGCRQPKEERITVGPAVGAGRKPRPVYRISSTVVRWPSAN